MVSSVAEKNGLIGSGHEHSCFTPTIQGRVLCAVEISLSFLYMPG